jgi:hypothetical protein
MSTLSNEQLFEMFTFSDAPIIKVWPPGPNAKYMLARQD